MSDVVEKRLPELRVLEKLIESLQGRARVRVESTVSSQGLDFPIYSIAIGSQRLEDPCVGFFGGVHGLERIGAEVVLSWLQTVSELMKWDEVFQARLEKSRLVFMPIVNPTGLFLSSRANVNGVDLMRNAPVHAEDTPPLFVGGQTYSRFLPWYRGQSLSFDTMELESQALCRVVEREILHSKIGISLDVHSGFGLVDRLWFPYAKSKAPPSRLVEVTALKSLLDRSYPHHFYQIEPQAKSYTTHGDLWDFLYEKSEQQSKVQPYLPLTLELGSWLWLKKNPRQIFSSLGAFNPILPHRRARILRRHLGLFDFLHRLVLSPQAWVLLSEEERTLYRNRGLDLWYRSSEV